MEHEEHEHEEHEAQNSKLLQRMSDVLTHNLISRVTRLVDGPDTARMADWMANQDFYKGKARGLEFLAYYTTRLQEEQEWILLYTESTVKKDLAGRPTRSEAYLVGRQ